MITTLACLLTVSVGVGQDELNPYQSLAYRQLKAHQYSDYKAEVTMRNNLNDGLKDDAVLKLWRVGLSSRMEIERPEGAVRIVANPEKSVILDYINKTYREVPRTNEARRGDGFDEMYEELFAPQQTPIYMSSMAGMLPIVIVQGRIVQLQKVADKFNEIDVERYLFSFWYGKDKMDLYVWFDPQTSIIWQISSDLDVSKEDLRLLYRVNSYEPHVGGKDISQLGQYSLEGLKEIKG